LIMDTSSELEIKQDVRKFYDDIGWQEIGEGVYQNARYEDLRPVSREYIHKCHLRVNRHLERDGRFLLDAGSGPIQYPEYLEYSRGYQARVCADISIVALKEARQRIGDRSSGGSGLFVVADIANLPFQPDVFDGVVSLHTIHHLPIEEHKQAYREVYRVLAPAKSAVVVNGWQDSLLMRYFVRPIKWRNRTRKRIRKSLKDLRRRRSNSRDENPKPKGKGTFVRKHDVEWLKQEVGSLIPLEIFVWRSVSVRFLRGFIFPDLGGRWLLRKLYELEERFPRFFGEYGQYPMIVIKKD
jgi:ubiquinone/menaquinone biosynthesis C-methylase UbiE